MKAGFEAFKRVQIDQLLRRLSWRVRRVFHRPADNDPIVSIEPRPAPVTPRPPPPVRPPRRRLARVLAGYLVTLGALALVYGAMVALNSRVALDLASAPPAVAGQSHVVAGAAALLALGADKTDEADVLLVPNGRRIRERRVRAGAANAAAHFISRAAAAPGRTDPALADAVSAIADGAVADPAARAVARDALLRLNTRIAAGQWRLAPGPAQVAALVRMAADACEAEARVLGAAAADGSWVPAPAVEARLYEARGLAYGWLTLVRAVLLDAPDLAEATVVEASIPVDALQRIVERQPLFLFNGGPAAPWAPAHVADTAADFTRAAAGARALAFALEQRIR